MRLENVLVGNCPLGNCHGIVWSSSGLMFPDNASLHITAIEDLNYREMRIHYWDMVYGFNMSTLREKALSEPVVKTVRPPQVTTLVIRIFCSGSPSGAQKTSGSIHNFDLKEF